MVLLLQVFNVLTWLNFKRIEQSKYAKKLLQKVRFSALTIPGLENILDNRVWIIENDKYNDIINKAKKQELTLH